MPSDHYPQEMTVQATHLLQGRDDEETSALDSKQEKPETTRARTESLDSQGRDDRTGILTLAVHGGDDECDLLLENKYNESLKLLQQNQVVINRMTEKLALIERETSSIVSELDALEYKISPMLAQHVAAYQKLVTHRSSEDDKSAQNEGDLAFCLATDDTTTTWASSLSKAHTPDLCSPGYGNATQVVHRYINLSDLGEFLPVHTDSFNTSGPFLCDVSSISRCVSFDDGDDDSRKEGQQGQNNGKRGAPSLDEDDCIEAYVKRFEARLADKSGIEELLLGGNNGDPFMISAFLDSDDLSDVSRLSYFEVDNSSRLYAGHPGNRANPRMKNLQERASLLKTETQTHKISDEESTSSSRPPVVFADQSAASFEKKSHDCLGLSDFNFTEDAYLLTELSQDLSIPASLDGDDNENCPPCFILGVKKRNKEDECNACVIC